ncbi:MAG: AIPR family protein [Candidatus Brocadiia bacterium]
MEKARIPYFSIRKFPDPLRDLSGEYARLEHYSIICRAIELPEEIPDTPNPREQNTDRMVYKAVRKSLESEEPTFHLKNKGITLLASRVDMHESESTATIHFGDGDGIVDGGHTYEIIKEARNASVCPSNQWVRVDVLVGVPNGLASHIAGGLNTTIQVQKSSLANLENKFDWIKQALKDEPFTIAYRENEEGHYDIRDIISLLLLFNVKLYPENGQDYPKETYTSKAKCLEKYLGNMETFEWLLPILKDILRLHDHVHMVSRVRYNEEFEGRAGGMKGVFEQRKRGKFTFVFTNQESEYRLWDGALYPILGSMRFLVREGSNGQAEWKLGSFDKVLRFYESVAGDMVKITYDASLSLGRNANALGKSENLWKTLFMCVALKYYSTQRMQ